MPILPTAVHSKNATFNVDTEGNEKPIFIVKVCLNANVQMNETMATQFVDAINRSVEQRVFIAPETWALFKQCQNFLEDYIDDEDVELQEDRPVFNIEEKLNINVLMNDLMIKQVVDTLQSAINKGVRISTEMWALFKKLENIMKENEQGH